jgi:hypothetical protein
MLAQDCKRSVHVVEDALAFILGDWDGTWRTVVVVYRIPIMDDRDRAECSPELEVFLFRNILLGNVV